MAPASSTPSSSTPRTPQLPPLRRKRRFDLPRYVGVFFSGVREVDEQVEPYAAAWDAHNAEVLAARAAGDGAAPLWVALGDSATQGVGASDWTGSWVLDVCDRLRGHTGEDWQVVNLSMSGGRFRDVIDHQLPVYREHLSDAALVTCVIGSNDMMFRRGESGPVSDASELGAVLPRGTVLSRLGGPGGRRRAINKVIDEAAAVRDFTTFNIWHWPSAAGALAGDRIHPSDIGYDHMAALAWEAIEPLFDASESRSAP